MPRLVVLPPVERVVRCVILLTVRPRPLPVVLWRIALEPLVLGVALLFLAIPDRLVLYGLLTWK